MYCLPHVCLVCVCVFFFFFNLLGLYEASLSELSALRHHSKEFSGWSDTSLCARNMFNMIAVGFGTVIKKFLEDPTSSTGRNGSEMLRLKLAVQYFRELYMIDDYKGELLPKEVVKCILLSLPEPLSEVNLYNLLERVTLLQ